MKNYTKLHLYISNGIIPGRNLITTYETTNHPLDFDTIEKPTTSFRKDPNLNIKEYNKKAYLRKKNMKLSDKIGE